MPRRVNDQLLLPLVGKIVACSGMVSPTFQPWRLASDSPTIAPRWSASQAFFCAAGILNSG